MDKLQVSIACLLLKMTFEPSNAGPLQHHTRCPTCPEGYFMIQSCTEVSDERMGIRCKPCSDCSAAHQDTLVKCSTLADSVCGNKMSTPVTPTETPAEAPAVLAPEAWIILTVLLVSVFLILLLSLLLPCCPAKTRKVTNTKVWICCD